MRRLAWLLLVWNVVFLAAAGEVSAADFLVPGSRGAAMAGSIVAVTQDGHSVWYNPAMLADTDVCRFGLQYVGIFPSLSTSISNYGSLGQIPYLQGNDSSGQLSQTQTRVRIQDVFNNDARPDPFHGVNISLLLPITKMMPKFPLRMGLGLSILVPGAGTNVVKVTGYTPDQPFYPVFGSRIQRLRIFAGLGFEIVRDMLSIGIGATVFTNIEGEVGSLTPMTTFDSSEPTDEQDLPAPSKATFGQKLGTTASPVFGLHFRPIKWLELGAYYRMEQSMNLSFDVAAGVDVNMGYKLVAEMPYYLKSQFFFIPSSAGFGGGFHVGDSLLLTAQLDWIFWSRLTQNINIADFDVIEGMINDQGGLVPLEQYGDFKVRSYPVPKIRSRDVFSPKAGLEWSIKGFTRFRLGYAYNPSALEVDQNYLNLLLDNNYHTVSGGVGFSLTDPLGYLEKPVLLDFHVLVDILEPRYNHVGLLDEAGGYHAKGVVETSGTFLSVGVELTLQL